MNTEFRYDFVKDISQKNDVLVVRGAKAHLQACVWTGLSHGDVAGTRLRCLKYVFNKLHGYDAVLERWLVVGQAALQEDTRLTRYLGLRKYLQRQYPNLPLVGFIEQSHESEGGLRFIGAIRWDLPDLESIHSLMRAQTAVIVLSRDGQQILQDIVHRGWGMPKTTPPLEVLDAASRDQIVVVNVYGEFDDRDVAVAAIGRQEVLTEFGIMSAGFQSG